MHFLGGRRLHDLEKGFEAATSLVNLDLKNIKIENIRVLGVKDLSSS